MSSHDKRSPSQLKKRFMCPGSYQMELAYEKVTGKDIGESTSSHAFRGTVLHSLIEPAVTNKSMPVAGSILVNGKGSYTLTEEDVRAIEYVVNEVRAELSLLDDDDTVLWEQQVGLEKYGIETKEGNRVDLYIRKRSGEVIIIEFKFGNSYVDEPKFNLQISAYVVGTVDTFGDSQSINAIILQPSAYKEEYRRREYTFEPQELDGMRNKISDIIKATDNKSAPIAKGDHCEYCAVKSICPMHRDAFLNVPTYMKPEEYFQSIDAERRKEFYEDLLATQAWVKNAIGECEEMILGGIEINGYEIGKGRMSRKWTLKDSEVLAMYPELRKVSVMTPPEAKELCGKKEFAVTYGPIVNVTTGAPKVVKDRKK